MINYLIWILVVILYAQTFYKLYSVRWDAVDYTHAYFILPVALWLVWRKKTALKTSVQRGSILGLPVLILGLLMFIFGRQQDYLFISALSIIPILFGLIIFLYGRGIAGTLSFPILYLLLLVPPPLSVLDTITLPMRHGTSVVTEAVLKLLGYPITRDGLLLKIGYHDIFMGAPCSGFRSLITMFSLVLVYVYISKGALTKKIILTLFIVPSALLGNFVRVIILCLITFYFGDEVGQGFFHYFSGVIVFIITLLGIMGVESLLEKIFPEQTGGKQNA